MEVEVHPGSASPEVGVRAFVASINGGDLQAASRCFLKDGCLLTPDATVVRGREEIRPILRQMIDLESAIEVEESSLVVAGEVALGLQRWKITSNGSEGSRFARSLASTLVLRRIEGSWKLAVAMPWGRG